MLSIPLNLLSLALSGRRRFRQPLAHALLGTLASIAMGGVLAVKASPGASLKDVVLSDKPAATAFTMGLPAAASALIARIVAPFVS